MDKEKSIITDEEYRVICAVFDKLGLDLTEKADVVSDLYTKSFVPLFNYTPEIAMILGMHAASHPDKKNIIEGFINQLSRVCETLGYVADSTKVYADIDTFLYEIEKKTMEKLIYKA